MTPRILYLVHDVTDPAVGRRIAMLKAGGAETIVAGFQRGRDRDDPSGTQSIILGRTSDGAFAQRVGAVGVALASRRFAALADHRPQVIIARNLEMLALGRRLARKVYPRPRLVYEILDIHRLLLGKGPLGRAMRVAERRLVSGTDLILTSSPAFIDNYLDSIQHFSNIFILENKVLDLEERMPSHPAATVAPNQPITIGWFGALRCSKSLALLSALVAHGAGAIEVTLRGRPARHEFAGFDEQVRGQPHLSYLGPYSAADLPTIYREVDFAWAIDFFEVGQNSAWLLPNRVYESCANGAVPIALAGTETARFLQRHGIGLVFDDLSAAALATQLRSADLVSLRVALSNIDAAVFRAGRQDCIDLVDVLMNGRNDRQEEAGR